MHDSTRRICWIFHADCSANQAFIFEYCLVRLLPGNESGKVVTEELKNESDVVEQPAPVPPEAAEEGAPVGPQVAAVTGEDNQSPADSIEGDASGEPLDDSGSLEPAAEEEGEGDQASDVEEEDWDEEDEDENVEPLELILDEEPDEGGIEKDWFILKVQSNRESSIRDALARRVQVAGLDRFFGDIIVPTEDVAEFKAGKKKIVKRKMYPGYIVVHLAINDDTWFLVRETPGIGDFTGAAGKPTPMLPHEVDRILKAMKPETEGGETPKTAIPFKPGDRVRIKDGTFENFEGEVGGIDEANGRVTVMINIFNRTTPAELEHWQIEPL